MILNFKSAPMWQLALPIIGLGAGAGLAYYQNKSCIGCYLGYSLTGLVLGSIPLLASAHQAGTSSSVEKVATSSFQETTGNTSVNPDDAKASVSGTMS